MDLAGFRAAVRYETGNDDDDQVSNTILDVWLLLAYQKLYRKLAAKFPELFTQTSATLTVSSNQLLGKPSRYQSLIRIELIRDSQWLAVPHATAVHPEQDSHIGYTEQATDFKITPAASAPGSYRIVYVQGPHESTFQPGEVTPGFEDVIIQWTIAKARLRFEEDPSPHIAAADDVWKEQVKALRTGRRGTAPQPGFVSGYGSGHDDGEWS